MAATFASGGVASAQTTAEAITSFRSTIVVNPDATISVSEDIVADFPEPRHGIDREIPIRYRDANDNWRNIKLTVDSVTDADGSPVQYALSRQGDDLRIRIGDPDRTVTGEQDYRIGYRVSRALLFFGDHDELYWNVSGDAWRIPLLSVGATVMLPSGITQDLITSACYTGPRGSTDKDCVTGISGDTRLFSADAPLTIAIGWPKGFVTAPTAAEEVRDFVSDNVAVALPIVVFLFMSWYWWTRGRDPKTGTLMAEYDPPDAMTPAKLAALVKMRVTTPGTSATIVDLAVRGFLTIEETGKDGLFEKRKYVLHKTKDADSSLDADVTMFFDALFDGRSEVKVDDLSTDQGFQKKRVSFQGKVLDGLTKDGYFAGNPATLMVMYLAIGFAIGFITLIFSEPITAAWGNMAFVAILISGGLVAMFGVFMPRRSQKGAVANRHALGFKLYLSMAEKRRIEWQVKENMFEKFLSYAMVFGVVDAWTRAFEGLPVTQPSWYRGAPGFVFSPATFGSSLKGFGEASAHAIAPSSSGSSGGGSSGGGFGGGGGGSW